MRNTLLLLAAALCACGGGGAATGPTDGGATPPAIAEVSVTPASGTVPVGGTLQLSVSARDAAGNPVTGLPAALWQSSDAGVATVAADGTVSGVAAGTATITASLASGGASRTASAQVTVTSPFAALRLSHTDLVLQPGGATQVTATPVDAAGTPIAGAPAATWRSDTPATATVAAGVISGVAPGSAVVTVSLTHGGATHTGTVRVTVAPAGAPSAATVRGIDDAFSPASVTIAAGGTVTWVMDDEEHDVTWDGAAPPGGDIPRMDRGASASRTFPTAGSYGYHCERHDGDEAGTVVVQAGGGAPPAFTSLGVAPSPASVAPGATVQLTATPRDQFGNPMSGLPAATWQTSDPAKATVSASGLVTGVAAGSATITATVTAGGVTRTGTSVVTVGAGAQPGTATVATVDRTFSPRTVTIAPGGTVTWQFSSTHNVTFTGAAPAGGNIGNTSSGAVSRQFTAAGSFGYECTLHSGMTGTVVVQ